MFRRKLRKVAQVEQDNRIGQDIQESSSERKWMKRATVAGFAMALASTAIIIHDRTMPQPDVIVHAFDTWGNLVKIKAGEPTSTSDRKAMTVELIRNIRFRSGFLSVDMDRMDTVRHRVTSSGMGAWQNSHKLFKDVDTIKEGQQITVPMPIDSFPDNTGQNITATWYEVRQDAARSNQRTYRFTMTFYYKPLEKTGGLSQVSSVSLVNAEEITGEAR